MSIFKETFPDFVSSSLSNRQDRLSNPTRRPELAIYQSTRNAFIRMTSGVEVNGDGGDLAKKYILQGGTLTQTAPGVDKIKSGVGTSFINNSYSSNGASGNPYFRGMRPMPGITGMSAECKTAYGSLIEATVTFQCWDIQQLEDLELLFMRPGYTVLLEWGWSYNGFVPSYYDILDSSKNNLDFQQAYKDIFNKCRDNKGEYEAILGYVKNYQWSARPDGGYDCTTNIISLGEVLESLKMNYAPLNIDLGNTGGFGLLKECTLPTSTTPIKPKYSNSDVIKDYYSKGILSGLLFEIQSLLVNAEFPDATGITGAYPDMIIGGKTYHVFKKQWNFKNKNQNPPPPLSAVSDTYNYYITLESLCDLVNTYVLPQNQDTKGTKSSLIEVTTYDRNYQVSGSVASELKCIAHPLQISTDPTKCLIKGDVWITGQTKGVQTPKAAVQGATSPLVKDILASRVRDVGLTRRKFFSVLDGYMKNPNETLENALRKIREEMVNYIKLVGSSNYVLGVFDPANPTSTIPNEGSINDNNGVIFNQNKQYGLNILKYLEYKTVDELFKDLAAYSFEGPTQLDGTKSFKHSNNLVRLFVDKTLKSTQISGGVQIDVYNFSPKKDDVNLKNILSKELDWRSLDYNGSAWGTFILSQRTSQVAVATVVTAKEVLKGLGSLREYFANSEYSLGNISNFYLDIDNLYSILTNRGLESRDSQGKNTINILEFFKVICQTMQECTGNINNFDIHIDGRDNKARIVDLNITPDAKTSNLFQIELHNLKSTARNYKLESKIFPEQGAMIAISAQAFQSSGQLGYNNSTLTAYNQGITDRLKPKVVTPSYVEVDEKSYINILLVNFTQLQKYFSSLGGDIDVSFQQDITNRGAAAAPVRVVNVAENRIANLNTKYAPGSYNNVLRDMLGFFSSLKENPNNFSGIIPVTLSIDMDGFGGVVIGNLFKINEEILPKSYKFFNTGGTGRQLGFLVKAFNHRLENNDWVTTIDAYPFIIPASNDIVIAADGFWSKFITEGINLSSLSNLPPTSPVSTTGFDQTNLKTAVQFFKNKKYTDYQVAAFVGSLLQESQLNPTLTNSKGAYGIAQWLDDRLESLKKFKKGWDTLNVQLEFIEYELKGTEKLAGDRLKSSISLEEAVTAAALYERYKGIKGSKTTYNDVLLANETGRRIGYAADLLDRITKGEFKK
jgi:hypothetical protein